MKHNLRFGLALGRPAVLKMIVFFMISWTELESRTNTKLEFMYIAVSELKS